MDAADTRALRPTVCTAASRLSLADVAFPAVLRAAAERDGAAVTDDAPRVATRAAAGPASDESAVETLRETVARAGVDVVALRAVAGAASADDDGIARDMPVSAARAGVQHANAKIHVINLFISLQTIISQARATKKIKMDIKTKCLT